MKKFEDINTVLLCKQLLALMQMGVRLEGRDGHVWIECEDIEPYGYNLHTFLKDHGVLLNNKIYGGVLEAIDTIDEAMKMCDTEGILDWYWEDALFLGNGGVDHSRIDSRDKGKGGIY